MKRIVIKVGTNVITRDNGLLNRPVMRSIVQQIIALKKKKIEVVLVSSGAVAAGRARLQKTQGASMLKERQVLAATGQVKLIETYARLFQPAGLHCAQVLATKEDFRDRRHYLCMRNCFKTLLHDNIIPIVNENEVVAVYELMFTDNDELAGLTASMLNVDAVFILTSVDGLFNKHPDAEDAELIKEISANQKGFDKYALPATQGSLFGRGGMHTKCRVAQHLARQGIVTHIVNGKKDNIILEVIAGTPQGTVFKKEKKVSNIKKWIAHAKGKEKGVVSVNACAEDLLKANDKARSLLPVGITKVSGAFRKGDIIEIQGRQHKVIGYGIAQYDSESAIEKMGQKNQRPLIHYDYLFINV